MNTMKTMNYRRSVLDSDSEPEPEQKQVIPEPLKNRSSTTGPQYKVCFKCRDDKVPINTEIPQSFIEGSKKTNKRHPIHRKKMCMPVDMPVVDIPPDVKRVMDEIELEDGEDHDDEGERMEQGALEDIWMKAGEMDVDQITPVIPHSHVKTTSSCQDFHPDIIPVPIS